VDRARDHLPGLVGGAVGLACAACFTPPAVLAPPQVDLEAALQRYPPGVEQVAIEVEQGRTLRGIFRAADPGAPVVLHLVESSGSVAETTTGYAPLCEQLADLGLASLVVDYGGVGLSSGKASAAKLADDARALWVEAVRRAGGDPGRVVLRGISLGTLAAAALLDGGARPGGVVLVLPVRAESVVRRFAHAFHGPLVAAFAGLVYRDVVPVDLVAVAGALEAPYVVVAAEQDALIGRDELERLELALPGERGSFAWHDGDHFVTAIDAHRLLPAELPFFLARAPAARDADLRERATLAALPAELAGRFLPGSAERAALRACAAWSAGERPLHVAAAALAGTPPLAAARLRWRLGRIERETPFEGLIALYDLSDPAGPLPLDLLERAARPLQLAEERGGMLLLLGAEDVAASAAGLAAGQDGQRWSSWLTFEGGMEVGIEEDHGELFVALVERGLGVEDAARQLARVLLKARGIPERLRRGADGALVLEAFEEGAWRALDLATVRDQSSVRFRLQRRSLGGPPPARRGSAPPPPR
jgi:hypothetical protein